MLNPTAIFNFAAKLYDKLSEVSPTVLKRDSFAVENPSSSILENPFELLTIDEGIYDEIDEKGMYGNAIRFLIAVDQNAEEWLNMNGILSDCPLNSDCTDRVLVYPVPRYVDRKKSSNETLNSLFRHLVYIPIGFFKKQKVSLNVVASSPTNIADGDSCLYFYFLPYPCCDMLGGKKGWIPRESSCDCWDSLYIGRLERLSRVVWKPCIVFGPEMMGSQKTDVHFRKIVQDGFINVAVAPSYHLKTDDNVCVNRSLISVAKKTETERIYHRKFMPASINGVQELIDSRNEADVTLIVVPGFGLVFVTICRDYLSKLYFELINSIQPDVVLTLCYTSKGDYSKFINKAKQLIDADIMTIIGNCCSVAVQDNVSPIIVIGKDDRGETTIYVKEDQLCGCNCVSKKKCFFEIRVKKDTKQTQHGMKRFFRFDACWTKEE